jgi:hypothetical protein
MKIPHIKVGKTDLHNRYVTRLSRARKPERRLVVETERGCAEWREIYPSPQRQQNMITAFGADAVPLGSHVEAV